MPLRPVPELLHAALTRGYALGYFESWNLESLQGVIEAAEITRSPVIIGFNGEFLTHSTRLAQEKLTWYGALGKAAAESASIPCGLIFNECASDYHTHQAVLAGFNLVMLADPEAAYEDYLQRVASLAAYAHAHGVAVEAEIGELPSGATGEIVSDNASRTDAEQAVQFVASTGIDLLSVSVGNIHILVDGERALDLDQLEKIHRRIDIPLGLHGGSGISADSLREAIRMGVTKVAYGTYLKQRYLAALRAAIDTTEVNPHKILGMGGSEDILVKTRFAVRDAILERIDDLGCCGRA